jgi:hypothetical protein
VALRLRRRLLPRHPGRCHRALGRSGPHRLPAAIWDQSTEPIRNDWNHGREWRAAGRTFPLIIGTVFGAKGISKIAKLRELSKVVKTGKGSGYADGAGIRRFLSDAEGEAYGNKYLGGVFTRLPADQQRAVHVYSRDGRPYSYTLRVDDPQAELDRMLSIPRDRQMLLDVFDARPSVTSTRG